MLHKLQIHNPLTGHDTLEFDPENPQSKAYRDATETFNRLVLKDQSHIAGEKRADGVQDLTRTFHPDVAETVLTPRTVGG